MNSSTKKLFSSPKGCTYSVLNKGSTFSVFVKKKIFSFDVAMCVLLHYREKETYEPRCEKTCLPIFRPGPTQTGLYCHRRWLEA